METTNEACAQLLGEVSGCLAVCVVDLQTTMLLGVHHVSSHFTQAYLDAIAAATVDLFRGPGVQRIEQLLSEQKGEQVQDCFEEIFTVSPRTLHFMKAAQDKQAVVVMVTGRDANQGLGWLALRDALPAICATLP